MPPALSILYWLRLPRRFAPRNDGEKTLAPPLPAAGSKLPLTRRGRSAATDAPARRAAARRGRLVAAAMNIAMLPSFA